MMTLANRAKKRSMPNLKFVKLVADKDLLPTVTIKPGPMSRPMMNMKRFPRISNPLSKKTSLTKSRLTIEPNARSIRVGIGSSLYLKASNVSTSSRENINLLRRYLAF